MTNENKLWLRSVGTMIGGIIGIGIFGLPYAFAQVGFFAGLGLLILVGILLVMMQLLYAEVTIQTPGHRRLTGLAEKYLGKWWKVIVAITLFSVSWGAMMAYIIVAGEFLFTLLGPMIGGTPFIYSVAFMIIESLFLLAGLRKISGTETYVVILLLLLFGAIIFMGLPEIHFENLINFAPGKLSLAYGVVLFSIAGLGIIPEIHDLLGEKHEHRLRSIILVSMGVIIAVSALFSLAVVGVSGSSTSEEAIIGLGQALGPVVSVVGSLLGVITLVSIFVIIGVQVKDSLMFDFKIRPSLAWLITVSVPIILFLIGVREFISVISFTGAVFGAINAIIIILVFEKLRRTVCTRRKCFVLPKWVSVLLMSVFVIGAVVEVVYLIAR